MTEQEARSKLAEIERSSNPELLCQELDDQTLLALMKIEQRYPYYLPRYATEEYQRRTKFRYWMCREVRPRRSNWTADPQ